MKFPKIDQAKRYRIEKWFWIAMILPTILWLRNSILWVAFLSIYALFLSAAAAEQAAQAKGRKKK